MNDKAKDSPRLTRLILQALPMRSLHAARNWSKAHVCATEWPPGSGRQVVVKDLRTRALWFRLLMGRYTLGREWKALRALRDLECVPSPIARPDADCIVMELCAGTPLMDIAPNALAPEVLANIEAAIAAMHERGVTHGDLHRSNILIGEEGRVTIIDWATACVYGVRRYGWKNRTFAEFYALDQRAVAKIKAMYFPQALSGADKESLLRGSSPLYSAVKSLRYGFDRLRGRKPKGTAQVRHAKYGDLPKTD